MLEKNLLLVISLLFIITLLTMLGNKLKVAYPIFLVIGVCLSALCLEFPTCVSTLISFLYFLPPVLFAAAWQIPWADFWKFRRPIARFGFGLVFFTSTLIAFLSHALIPGFTLALGFVLGGIISPPDAVAATSVLRKLNVPRNIVTMLEGESLVNDASSLIVFRFALLAVTTGQFSF
ncbi:cation:proton antiporter [Niabella defluvii]|nr:cation:proton antiporter [Niabella sp. I65]